RMTVAGFGDLIGKLTCLNDWELARIINGEHYCHNIVTLVRECVADVIKEAPKIKQRDPETLGSVMRGLVLSGAAISLYGDSRPASGAEHHMSHYWETILEQRGIRPAMHGEQVAVGTVLVLMLIEELLQEDIDFAAARELARAYDYEAWEQEIRAHYGIAADEVIAMEQKAGKNAVPDRLRRIDSMEKNWDAVRAQLMTLPSSSSLRSLLRDIGCPCTPAEIGVDDALLMDTFRYCKEIRARYTVFQTVYDLGLTDKLAARVIEKANSAD
ncbi:MAG: iron-containing alcohol dehydrogenase, partial [Candidatus Limivicinus sp.]|nr:iron-containing alcohol dehydrogenase [Candidatus Limivicinus sp.]